MRKALQMALGAIVLTTVFSLQSCDKITDVVKTPDINFTGASADIVIPPTNDTTAQGEFAETEFTYDLDSMIKSQTGGVVGYSAIKSVKITHIKLTLTDGSSTNNFANFQNAGAAFHTDANGGNYDSYEIAHIENNPDTYNTVLEPTVIDANEDVKKYFNSKTRFTYLVFGKLRRPITTTLHCHVDITYTIAF